VSTIHRDTRVTLGKMFGMLGSDHDGEVLAAVAAIKRRMALFTSLHSRFVVNRFDADLS